MRRSRRYAIADAFSQDYADVEQYQPGQTKLPIFQMGNGYAVALRNGDRLPEGYAWRLRETLHGYDVYYADPS